MQVRINILLSMLFFSFIVNAQESFKISTEIRPRMQFDNRDFNNDTKLNTFAELRSRLGISLMPAKNISGFFQIQDSRIYGSESSTLADAKNLDLHQAYFNINSLFNLPLDLKLGRMELLYGPQRLIGPVGWHNVGRSFDGGVLSLQTKKFNVDFIMARTAESEFAGDSLDSYIHSLYGEVKLVENYLIQPFIIMESRVSDEFSRYTLGIYVSGTHNQFSHELEAAYQLGSFIKNVDISAYMFAANLSYTFAAEIKPKVTAGIDYLSGDNGKDLNKYKAFNTLYATNHKYYGYMDYFINIPADTYGKGLVDIHGKFAMQPAVKLNFAAAYHLFNSAEDFNIGNNKVINKFGSELDLTLNYKYSEFVNFTTGFSFFTPGDVFKITKGGDSSTWGYMMIQVNL